MIRKAITCALMLGLVGLAFASSGGGKKKSSAAPSAFASIRSSGGFNFKSKPVYAGSYVFGSQNTSNSILYKSVVTYQKGNTIYVVPAQYRMSTSRLSSKSNLNAIDLKIRLCK